MAIEILRYVGALLLVLALIGAAGIAARKWGVPGVTKSVDQKRLAVIETLMIGPRQKLFIVRRDNVDRALAKNPILITALNAVIGYEKGAAIAKQAYKEGRSVLDVAREQTGMSERELRRLLDPLALTKGGIHGPGGAGG